MAAVEVIGTEELAKLISVSPRMALATRVRRAKLPRAAGDAPAFGEGRKSNLLESQQRSWPCENFSGRATRRNISEQLHLWESNHTAHAKFDALLENCVFYISRMYEFLHSQDPFGTGSL
jgi:hypothetical protein